MTEATNNIAQKADAAVAASEKAFASAANAVEAKAVEAKVAVVEKTTAAAKTVKAIAKKSARKVAVKKLAPVKTVAAKKPVVKAAAKIAAPTKKITAKKVATKKAPAAKATGTVENIRQKLAGFMKEAKMNQKFEATAEEITARAQELFGEAGERAKQAYAKSAVLASKAGEITKGNLEAVVESGKILAGGVKDMGKGYVADGKSNLGSFQADVKKFAAVKSPTEFFQLQGELLRKGFDLAVAQTSKNTEATIKLANDAFQPISNRISTVIEEVKKAA